MADRLTASGARLATLICAALMAGACGTASDASGGTAQRAGAGASPTVAELGRRGFDIVSHVDGSWSCGPGCREPGVVSVEMARPAKAGGDRTRYRCPKIDAKPAQWRCTPFVRRGAGATAVPGGRR